MRGLRNALGVLSKSSPQAVEVEKGDEYQNVYKDFLYIETQIERDFANCLESLEVGEIIFLCGSSGDGKSAILTRYSKKESGRIRFHLDATHSLDPYSDAIDELDKLFSETAENRQPLVVGINVGMMGNYVEGGSEEHIAIRESMSAHIQNGKHPGHHHYFDFEHYPKFEFREHQAHSSFADDFMKRLTQAESNPFLELLEQHENENVELVLCANFRMLMKPEVQEVVIDSLMKARLIEDQFMTARALLDFIFHLLTGPGYLFDNLYAASDNELSQRIIRFDPATIRSKEIDQFILESGLRLLDKDFLRFRQDLQEAGITNLSRADSHIRLFHLFREVDFSNNYHHRFKSDFSNSLLEDFARIWKLHDAYHENISKEEKSALQAFYNDVLLIGLRRYMNRKAPELRHGHYLIEEYNGVNIVARLKLKFDLAAIEQDHSHHTATFNAFLKVGKITLPVLVVSISLYELLGKLGEGYRPNKHDKSTVLILDELVAHVVDAANQEDTLLFFDGDDHYEVEEDNGDLQIMEA